MTPISGGNYSFGFIIIIILCYKKDLTISYHLETQDALEPVNRDSSPWDNQDVTKTKLKELFDAQINLSVFVYIHFTKFWMEVIS